MATRYVDPNASVGGDGTTNGLSGATAAYVSLAVWEAARQATLSEIENVICSTNGGAADTTECVIDGWTTSASNYINITVDAAYRHAGVWDAAKYRVVVAAQNSGPVKNIEPYTRMAGLQIENTFSPVADAWFALLHDPGVSAANDDARFDAMVLRDSQDGFYQADGRSRWTNSVSYGNSGAGFRFAVAGIGSCTVEIYNCVAVANTNSGFHSTEDANIITCRNCYAGGNGTQDFETVFANGTNVTHSNNASSDSTAVGTGSLTSVAYSTSSGAYFVNTTAGSQDLHIRALSALKGVGTSLSGTFTTDIDGQTRGATWDIGADQITGFVQFESAASGSVTGNTTLTFAITIADAPNRELLVGITTGGSDIRISTVTYDGVSMTEEYDATTPSPAFSGMALYKLAAPNSGTHNVVVTAAASANILAVAVAFANVDQVTPIDAYAVTTGEDNLPTNSRTSVEADMVVDFVGISGQVTTGRVGAGQIERGDLSNATESSSLFASTRPGLAGATSMTWAQDTGGGNWASIAMNVNINNPLPGIIQNMQIG